MNSYLANFIVYTLAMIGFIVLVLFIYKKSMYTPLQKNNKDSLSVETSLKLSPTKTIYILKVGAERFLIAGDSANTTMLSKLDNINIDINTSPAMKTEVSDNVIYKTSNNQR